MKEIVFKDDFAFIYLNSSFYSISKIKESYGSYIEFISIDLKKIGNYIVLKIKKLTHDYDLKILTYEFLNFLLNKLKEEN